jgi:hypothetical protein
MRVLVDLVSVRLIVPISPVSFRATSAAYFDGINWSAQAIP